MNPLGSWDPSPNQQVRYFSYISAWTFFLGFILYFIPFIIFTHLVGYISKL